MLIKELPKESREKLIAVGFKQDHHIDGFEPFVIANVFTCLDFTPLTYAAYCGDIKIVKDLIENGADINGKDWTYKFTPLMWASWYGRDRIVEYLLKNGADITHKAKLSSQIEPLDAYKLSKIDSKTCCSSSSFWYKAQKTFGYGDIDKTQQLIKSYRK